MAKVPVKVVSWEEIVEWTRGLAKIIEESGWMPDVIVAVARGGYVPARLLCDFLDITDLLSVQSQHWTEAAKAAEKAILKYPYKLDMSDKRILVVDDIVDTGETLLLAREYIEKEWNPKEVKLAALQWISPVAKFRPEYYYIEVKDWVWFQYPWTRLEDLQQFIMRLFREDQRLKDKKEVKESYLKEIFMEWYGVSPEEFGEYWSLAIDKVRKKGYIIS